MVFSALSSAFPSRDIKWGAVATLINSIIGVSVLAMPHCFVRCGVVLGTVILACSATLTIVSCNLLFSAAAMSTTVGILRGSLAPPSYQIVALRTLGPWAKFLAEIAISSMLFGISISYFVIVGDLAPDLLRHLFFAPDAPGDPYFPSWITRLLVLIPLTYGVALPLSLQPDFSGRTLFFVNATALSAYVLLAARIVLGALVLAPHTPLFSPSVLLTVSAVHPFSLLPSVSIFVLALSCQFQLLSLCTGEDPLSVVDARLAAKVAVVLATLLYWCIGVFGYVALLLVSMTSSTANGIPGDIFLTLNQMGMVDNLLKLGFLFALIAGFPLMVIPVRNCIYTMTVRCTSPSSLPSASSENLSSLNPSPAFIRYSTVALLTVCLVLAITFPDMEFVLELTGSTAGICVCYVLPSLMYAWAVKRQNRIGVGTESPPHKFQHMRLYLAYAMAIFGLCIAFIAVFIPSMALITDDEHVLVPEQQRVTPELPIAAARALPEVDQSLAHRRSIEDSLKPPSLAQTFLGTHVKELNG